MAHVLERRRRAVPDSRAHRAGRVRAVLPGTRRLGRHRPGRAGGFRPADGAIRARGSARDDSRAHGPLRAADARTAVRRLEAVTRLHRRAAAREYTRARPWPTTSPTAESWPSA